MLSSCERRRSSPEGLVSTTRRVLICGRGPARRRLRSDTVGRWFRTALVVVSLSVAACVPRPSEALNPTAENPSPSDVDPVASTVDSAGNTTSAGDASFPLDALLMVAWEDQRTLILAEQTLIAGCMRSQGWPYELPQVPIAAPGGPPRHRWWRRGWICLRHPLRSSVSTPVPSTP